ncbi:MAG TPA: TonB-dependent receptor [Candidatus Acidoferrales bacterium]|nr:TonB-dependent receptor [Candidatus Acidoferrales bacterium]
MNRFRFLSAILATLFLIAASSRAQSNEGRILGTIRDSSGGVVVGAKVTVTNTAKEVSRDLLTNDTGEYVAPALEPGLYTVSAESAGFKIAISSVVRLEVAQDLRIDLQLQPGAVTETIVVNEEAASLIDTTNPTLGGSFSNKEINELPLQGRDWQNLVMLLPGVDRTPGGGFHSIISNGARPEDNNYIVDGTDDNDLYYGTSVLNEEGVSGTPASLLPIDAIQEFSTQEHPTAEYGWKPGAVINIGLKSGTDQFHGSAYYFARNSAADARNFFDTVGNPLAPLILHQFGGSAGGPIVKDKLFFFAAYEGVRDIVGNPLIAESPNTGSLGGDLTNSIPDVISHCNALPGCAINQLSMTLSKLYPSNTGAAGPGLLFQDLANRNRADNVLVKVDYHFSAKNTFTARYFFADSTQTEEDGDYLLPQFLSQALSRPQIIGGNWAYTPNSSWVNEARFGYNRISQQIVSADHNVNPLTYGINTGVTNPLNFGLPEIDVGPFFQLGGGNGFPLFTTPTETYQLTDSVGYLKGRHNLHFGVEFRHGAVDNTRNRHAKGEIFFPTLQDFLEAGSVDLGNGTTDLGCNEDPCGPENGEVLVGDTRRIITQNAFGAYVADEFRFNSRLTITAGLRYDLSGVIHAKNDLLANFEPNIGFAQVGQQISQPYHVQHDNFAPRLGVAWDPWGTGKTVFRSGAGIIYETAPISDFIGQTAGGGIGLNAIPTGATGVTPGGGSIFAAVVFPSGSQLNWEPPPAQVFPFLGQGTSCSRFEPCSITSVRNHLDTPYTIFWNFNVQRAIGNWSSLQVGYVGQRGVKLFSLLDINQPNPTQAAACDAAFHDAAGCEQESRPFFNKFPFLGETTEFGNAENSSYDGLQVTYKTHSWKGLNIVAGYTYAHAIDEASGNRHFSAQNSLDVRAERGNSDFDLRHRFTFALTYAISGREGFAQLLKGWQLNSIVILESGMPYSLNDFDDDFSFTGEFNDRWNITGSPKNIHWSTTNAIPFVIATDPRCIAAAGPNPAEQAQLTFFGGCYISGNTVLTPPANGTFGNMGRNIFRGPDFTNWDFSISKNTKLGERVTLQLRAEFFNILNHPNFSGIDGELADGVCNSATDCSSSAGLAQFTPDIAASNPVLGSGGSRHIQLGAKFLW